jgi:hypothetical protein
MHTRGSVMKWVMICMSVWNPVLAPGQSSPIRFDPPWFYFVNEFFNYPMTDMQLAYSRGMGNAFQINRTSVDNTIAGFSRAYGVGLIDLLPASSEVTRKMGGFPDTTAAYIQREFLKLRDLGRDLGSHRVWWNLMPEYDQVGGWWADIRQTSGTTRPEAYASWRGAYAHQFPPLDQYLNLPQAARGAGFLSLNVYSFATHYSYDMGADMVVLERNNDEIGDIQTGIGFVRGAARQYDRPWGIDISTWRAASQSATEYDGDLKLIGGWSPSYMRRHLYLAYMSGADMILNEGSVWYNAGRLNPLGQTLQEVADFCLKRHPDIGKTVVPAALLIEFSHGFEPKFGRFSQSDYVWYWKIPYNNGDRMIHRLLEMFFPGYWKSGTLPPNAPQTPADYRAALRRGADPRPWEPMGESRWGDQLDILLSNASLAALKNYRVIILAGSITVDDALRQKLDAWVEQGGTLVITAGQIRSVDETLAGVRRTGTMKKSSTSLWSPDGSVMNERPYSYELITTTTATVVAVSGNGDPLITRNVSGAGEVLCSSAHYMVDDTGGSILSVGERMFTGIFGRVATATVSGPFGIEYVTNRSNSSVLLTLVNNTALSWEGSVSLSDSTKVNRVRDWIKDTDLPLVQSGGTPETRLTIAPYDIAIVAFELVGDSTVSPVRPRGSLELFQNYPNPFTTTTTIQFRASCWTKVNLAIFDMVGRHVRTLMDAGVEAGHHVVEFDGGELANGVYVCRLESESSMEARAMTVIR